MNRDLAPEREALLAPAGRLVVTRKGSRWLASGHPWLYRDDVAHADGAATERAALVVVEDDLGRRVGWALAVPRSRIAARMVARGEEVPDEAFWRERIARCVDRRARLDLLAPDGACRLIAGDADGIPGLVADLYAGVLVLQSGSAAADGLLELWADAAVAALPFTPHAVVDRSDASVRRLEELAPRTRILSGELPAPLVVREGELAYEVDVLSGHKTGHYLDQRDNRARAARHAAGAAVLDAFSYDGLFGLRAALAGARAVVCVDQSREAGERCLRNAERNGVGERVRFERADCLDDLKRRVVAGERYGLVVLDPPPFARNRREIDGAERGYVEINRRGIELTAPGGVLVTASCSHNVRAADFREFLATAAWKSRREVWLERETGAPPDHSVRLELPESAYLKCAFLRVGDARP